MYEILVRNRLPLFGTFSKSESDMVIKGCFEKSEKKEW